MVIVSDPVVISERIGTEPTRDTRVPWAGYIAPALYVIALVAWVVSVMTIPNQGAAGQYGLLATDGGLLLIVAMIATVSAFLYSIVTNRLITAAVGIGIAILVQRVTVALVTEIPIYTWTYKHIGLVDYILVNHKLAPSSVDIYNQWPGFFTTMAWFSTAAGVDPVDVAHWFAPVTHLVTAVLVVTLAMGLGLDKRTSLTAAMIVEALNWVGQDYYAPQAVALIMALSCLTLLAYSRKYPIAGYLAVAVFAGMVPSHQLTPMWMCGVVVALTIFRQIRPFWLPVAFIGVALAYVVPRLNYIGKYGLFTGSNPVANSSSNLPPQGSEGRVFTMLVDRSLSASVWVIAAICFLIIWKVRGAPWAAGIIGFSSMMLLGGQSYGGEAIFRVFLYSLPGCAILIATVVIHTLDARRKVLRVAGIGLILAGLLTATVASMQGYVGGWSYITMTKAQLEQSRWLLAQDPEGATITVLAPAGWPERPSAGYVSHAFTNPEYDKPLVTQKEALSDNFPESSDIDALDQAARNSGGRFYVVLPKQANTYSNYYGIFRPDAGIDLANQLSLRRQWVKVIDDADTTVFSYSEDR